MAAKVWTDRWQFIRNVGSGGHGRAQLVADKQTGIQGVLKLLIENDKQERRDRLHNEALALETLEHPRLPKLLDHNVEERLDKTVELYIVSEFIPGREMSKLAGPCALDDAVACIEAIVETVEHCHARNVKHRDLKPTNVMLRNDNIRDPVVIDFGQSFNECEAAVMQTDTGAGLGNRCMHLPELQPGSADKRNELTDLSFCAGIFFWLITHHCPRELGRDHNGKYPHEREPAASAIAKFPEPVRRQLLRFFTMGLARGFEQRIPSVESFREKLDAIRNPATAEAQESMTESLKQMMADVEQDSGYLSENRANALREALWQAVVDFANGINQNLGPKIGAQARRQGLEHTGVFYTSLDLHHAELQRGGAIRLIGEIQNNEFLIGGASSLSAKPPILDRIDFWDSEFKMLINRSVQRVASDLVRQWLLNRAL
jgi:serine/threonine protein kinase